MAEANPFLVFEMGEDQNNLKSRKKVAVEYLYLDLNTCRRCISTDTILDEVMAALEPALKMAGYEVDYRKVEMATREMAISYRFRSSPTILVNGRDVMGPISENSCGCCSDISNTAVDCRTYEYEGRVFEVPPKEMIAKKIMAAIFANIKMTPDNGEEYELPENLRVFFEGKNQVPGK